MVSTTAVDWLRRQDPNYLIIRRALRVTVVACLGFYGCRYGLGDTVLATYAIFGSIATGVLAQLPGSPSERARGLLAALPAAWILVATGTILAANTWAAVAGMLVVGFAVSFAGVGGPRLVGLATAFQLFYILPCFPPYAPDTLLQRLGGLTLGIGLIALSEVALWPDPKPTRYSQRLADAADNLAAYIDRASDVLSGDTTVDGALDRVRADAFDSAEQLRPSKLSPTQRPASAGAEDRALRHAGAALRHVMAQANRLMNDPNVRGARHCELARLLRQAASTTRTAGRTVVGERSSVRLDELDAAGAEFEHIRANRRDTDIARMRPDTIALELTEGVRIFATATRIAADLPVPRDDIAYGNEPGPFWYAHRSAFSLWWWQFRAHLTPRSVYFQEALRVALALAGARAVTGGLGLSHGLWTLLAILALMRTSAVDTRTTLRPALIGTFFGALASAGLLTMVHHQDVIVALLPVTMLLTFTAGRLLGVGWSQGLFTVLITMVFAQLAPSSWTLAGSRLLDVLIGAMIGLLAGLLAWPRGGGGELRRAVANCLNVGAAGAEETVHVLVDASRPGGMLPRARAAILLAEASFAQYQSERPDPRMSGVDWHAALIAAHAMVHGGESLMRRYSPGSLGDWTGAAAKLLGYAERIRGAYTDLAAQLPTGRITQPVRVPSAPEYSGNGSHAMTYNAGATVQHVVDVDVWLTSLAESLARIQEPAQEHADHARETGSTGR